LAPSHTVRSDSRTQKLANQTTSSSWMGGTLKHALRHPKTPTRERTDQHVNCRLRAPCAAAVRRHVLCVHDLLHACCCCCAAPSLAPTTCLCQLALRAAHQQNLALGHDGRRYEILSLVGTVSVTAGSHLHISLGDKDGHVIGGHLIGGATIFTTAEVVCGTAAAIRFERPHDPRTGYPELAVVHVAAGLSAPPHHHQQWLRELAIASIFFSLGCVIAIRR
jgi:hypothetical protein